ncbi:MAG: hypothetical protein RL186_874, partial [Pseudomonadota bacterium]
MSEDPIVIVGYARTPIGGLMGELATLSASDLGAVAVKAAVAHAGHDVVAIDTILMGNVLGAGQGQAPARQAALKAGLPEFVEATTLNKMCGSGLQAVILASQAIKADDALIVVAGGMESMSNAPHLIPSHRAGFKYGHDRLLDHMAIDGLEDAYEGLAMGVYADRTAEQYQFSRAQQDAYALETLSRAQRATADGSFASEIAPVTVKTRGGKMVITADELPSKARPDKIPDLRPAFSPNGTVTAANASAISDGAAALVLMPESRARKTGATIHARIVAHSGHAQAPDQFTTAPVHAIRKALERAGW